MNDKINLIIGIVVILAALYFVFLHGMVPYENPPANIMDPGAWQVGPIMGSENMSRGVPLRPLLHLDGWSVDIPYPDINAGQVGYITVPTGPLTGRKLVRLNFRLEMAEGVKLCPAKSPDSPSLLTLYFQRRWDNWSGRWPFETFRWYASFATIVDLHAGEYTLEARFDQNWTAVETSSRKKNPSAFQSAIDNAGRIGFVLGGGDGLGHGVFATGPARIVVTGFTVE